MKKLFFRLSFKKRIWLSFVLLTNFAVALTGFMSYLVAENLVIKNNIERSQETVNKTSQVLDEQLKRMTVTVLSMMISEPVRNVMKDAQLLDKTNYYMHLSSMQSLLAQAKMNEPLIHSIFISTPIGDFFPVSMNRTTTLFQNTDLYAQIKETGKPTWIEAHEDLIFSGKERVISLVLEAVSEQPIQGMYLLVNIRQEALMAAIYNQLSSEHNDFLLISRNGNPVLGQIPKQLESVLRDPLVLQQLGKGSKGNFVGHSEHENYQIYFSKLAIGNDWLLVNLQANQELIKRLDGIKWITFLMTAGCMLLAFLVSNVLTGLLLRPLYKLQNVIRKVEQNNTDLSVRYHSDYEDEVSQVGYRFNRMLEQISHLIEEVKEIEWEKRKQEVKALQAQIDPHFLYNTLNTIYWKAETNQITEVKEMIFSLSLMFRLGLNNGQEMTTVEKELDHVNQYLSLIQKSYRRLFQFRIEVEEDRLLRLPILKVLLQPLVENSILHGFADVEEGGEIRIRVAAEGDMLRIAIEDNGCGMNAEEVSSQMQDSLRTKGSFALKNIFQRLKLYYGERSTMDIQSEPYVNTTIVLQIIEPGKEEV
jgi:two-component system sensor histidine kinase YesM